MFSLRDLRAARRRDHRLAGEPWSTFCQPPVCPGSSATAAAPRSAAEAADDSQCGGSGGDGNASTFGDPHLIDFNGDGFDFQQAGEFTLLKSTTDDFLDQIQIRQQPDGNCCVAFNTAVAMRVGAATVELVPDGPDGLVVYLDKHRTFDRRIALGAAGSLVLTTQDQVPLAEVSLADASTVEVYSMFGALGIDISLASDRSGHLTGLLGDWSGSAATEFVGRNGQRYAPSVITGTSTRDVGIRCHEFGASWRITQRQSLFLYPAGESTRSFLVPGFPHKSVTLAGLRRALRAFAENLCRAAGITKTELLDACALDVGATGRRAFAIGDARVVRALGPTAPGWVRLSSETSTLPATFPPALAQQVGSVLAAYGADGNHGIEVARFSATPRSPGHGVADGSDRRLDEPGRRVPGAGRRRWCAAARVRRAQRRARGPPLNGLDALAQQPDGSFGAPASVASTGAAGAAGSVVLAHDGRTLLWSTNGLLGVENGRHQSADRGEPHLSQRGHVRVHHGCDARDRQHRAAVAGLGRRQRRRLVQRHLPAPARSRDRGLATDGDAPAGARQHQRVRRGDTRAGL